MPVTLAPIPPSLQTFLPPLTSIPILPHDSSLQTCTILLPSSVVLLLLPLPPLSPVPRKLTAPSVDVDHSRSFSTAIFIVMHARPPCLLVSAVSTHRPLPLVLPLLFIAHPLPILLWCLLSRLLTLALNSHPTDNVSMTAGLMICTPSSFLLPPVPPRANLILESLRY